MLFVRSKNYPNWAVLVTQAPVTDYSFRIYDFMINEVIYTENSPEFIKAHEQQKIMENLTGHYRTVK